MIALVRWLFRLFGVVRAPGALVGHILGNPVYEDPQQPRTQALDWDYTGQWFTLPPGVVTPPTEEAPRDGEQDSERMG